MTAERINMLIQKLDVRIEWLNAKADSFTHNTQVRKKYIGEIMREEQRRNELIEQLNRFYSN